MLRYPCQLGRKTPSVNCFEVKMASSAREIIKMKSSESTTIFTTIKNRRNTTGRIELKRYDKRLRKHVTFKESK